MYTNKQVAIPSGVPPTLDFQDFGLRTYAALMNNKNKSDSFGLIIGKVDLYPCLFF